MIEIVSKRETRRVNVDTVFLLAHLSKERNRRDVQDPGNEQTIVPIRDETWKV